MQQLVLVISLLVASASAGTRFDDDLREFVEYIKQEMPCGFPVFGIPPIAPYTEDFRFFDFTNRGVGLKGNLTNLTVAGLNDLDITELTYTTFLFRIKFDVKFNQIKIASKYIAKGGLQLLGLPLPLNGNGDLTLILENVRFNGSFRVRPTTSNGLQIFAFHSNLELNQVQSQTTGINNSPIFTKIFNDIVEEFFMILSEDYQDEINNRIKSLIVPQVNQVLDGVSIVELMALVFNLLPSSGNFPICQL